MGDEKETGDMRDEPVNPRTICGRSSGALRKT